MQQMGFATAVLLKAVSGSSSAAALRFRSPRGTIVKVDTSNGAVYVDVDKVDAADGFVLVAAEDVPGSSPRHRVRRTSGDDGDVDKVRLRESEREGTGTTPTMNDVSG